MTSAVEVLHGIAGGRVLDVATGSGGFVHTLVAGLRSFDEIIGIDADPDARTAFEDTFGARSDVRFIGKDALRPAFEDASFDTVSVSNSLHHFPHARALLRRMQRLLRRHGTFILAEMYRDAQPPPARTHVRLHHWAASIDRLQGVVHRRTYRKSDLVQFVEGIGLAGLRLSDVVDDDDPMDPETIMQIEAVIERQQERAAGHPDLAREGASIRRQLHRVGITGATTLVAVGRGVGVGGGRE
jgi:SAM-dependent methyltransferase